MTAACHKPVISLSQLQTQKTFTINLILMPFKSKQFASVSYTKIKIKCDDINTILDLHECDDAIMSNCRSMFS